MDQRHLASKRIKRLAQDGGCVDDEGLERDHRLRSRFAAVSRATLKCLIISTAPVPFCVAYRPDHSAQTALRFRIEGNTYIGRYQASLRRGSLIPTAARSRPSSRLQCPTIPL